MQRSILLVNPPSLNFRTICAVYCFILFSLYSYSQSPVQTIRGRIVDKESKAPLPGVNIILTSDTVNFIATTADMDGYYRLENIPLGRQSIRATYIGYQPRVVSGVIVNAGKEVLLNIEMEESAVAIKEVEITATRKGDVINEMSSVSARAFTVDETERYAGNRGDPARMASNFAGVQGADDSRNDLVIRGNSPMGVLWRVDGIDIPNPNHFAIAGTTGGPLNIINNKTLANSDFFTGAFPAEFGNALAGVFDMKLRNGNNEKHEYSGQFGLFGTELAGEGPISKNKRSSYLFAYRYSTLSIFKFIGLDLGTKATPKYQDLTFKFNFPTRKGAFSVFGIGGMSDIGILISEQKKPDREIYGQQDRDQYFGTRMGVLGVSYTASLNVSTFIRMTVATTVESQKTFHQLVYRHTGTDSLFVNDSLADKLHYTFMQGKATASFFINKKINARQTMKAGFNAHVYQFDFIDSIYNEFTDSSRLNALTYKWTKRWDFIGNAALIQPYIQWKYKITEKLTINAGVTSIYFTLNKSWSSHEPRIGLKWELSPRSSFNAGIGLHSQMQPTYTYFYPLPGTNELHNYNMGLSKSVHHVIGYDRIIGTSLRFKTEAYYLRLSEIPVQKRSSSFSLVNEGSGFSRFFPDTLQNTGTGENYGIEFTAEKFFSRKYFFMTTLSLYNSKYWGSDGVLRNTDFNGNYIFNFLGAREFQLGEKSTLLLGGKITTAGNKRYSPVDTLATVYSGDIVYSDSLRNTQQFKDYFRADIKITYRINAKKVTHEIGVDLVNILSNKNILKLSYGPDPDKPGKYIIREEYQLGFLPIFYYKADF